MSKRDAGTRHRECGHLGYWQSHVLLRIPTLAEMSGTGHAS
jgi:hypothetical protein